ncbi:MAG: peptide-methionine (R)-S-oxide reductase MsrB [Polaribacter sp.]|nr:peptide-methionine (R)-S-oxide reductase MsrB [Polaribacter sp.]MDG1810542.1 peptide-methionine (R)-S-oxide reductase MsrB [Polaribacter sp.]MDG1993386.1 peptide-methionine (R)-S-oxide reductase MsrB [Polaribacter sp.]
MKKILSLLLIIILFSCSSNAQKKNTKQQYQITKTEAEWRNLLSPEQYYVLRESGTERAFSHPYNDHKTSGIYVCAACKTPLYLSKYKYDSGSGWPSFDRAVSKNVETDVDYEIGYARTELKCNTCGGHLGHSFDDGPSETTGLRHCINGTALQFIPKKTKEN